MTWVRLDEDFPEHPKIARVGALGMALQVAAIAYCNRNLTDGFVPYGVAPRLISFTWVDANGVPWTLARMAPTSELGLGSGEDIDAEWVIGLLVDAAMWTAVPGGYTIHDFDHYQPPRAVVIADREAARDRQRKSRARKASRTSSLTASRTSSRVTAAPGHGPVTGAPVPRSTEDLKTPRGRAATTTTPNPNPVALVSFVDDVPAADAYKPANGLTELQDGLFRDLRESGWSMTFGGLNKLNADFGRPVVTDALMRARSEHAAPDRPFPWLRQVCRDIVEGRTDGNQGSNGGRDPRPTGPAADERPAAPVDAKPV